MTPPPARPYVRTAVLVTYNVVLPPTRAQVAEAIHRYRHPELPPMPPGWEHATAGEIRADLAGALEIELSSGYGHGKGAPR